MAKRELSNILVTGAKGFIGSNLVEMAICGQDVKNQFNDVLPMDIRQGSVSPYLSSEICCKAGDDVRTLPWRMLEGVDVIYHCAAITDMIECNVDFMNAYDVNYIATIRLAEICDLFNFKPIIIFPSSFGAANPIPPSKIRQNVYFHTKYLCEKYLSQFANVIIVRFPNPYGPRGRADSVVTRFLKEDPITIYGDGSQTRDFVFIADLCRHLLDVPSLLGAKAKNQGQPIHIGSGISNTVNELVECIEKATGKKKQVKHLPRRPFDVDHPEIKTDLMCKTSLADGLEITVDYMKRYGWRD